MVVVYFECDKPLVHIVFLVCSVPKDVYYDHACDEAARNKEEEIRNLPQQSKYTV